MKQQPSKLKFKKYHKARSAFLKLAEQKNITPLKGLFGLKALSQGKMTFKQIEAGRRTIRRTTKKIGRLHINVFPYSSVTKKPVSSRMGKGKGAHSVWICPIRKGQIIYEVSQSSFDLSLKALIQAGSKMPFKTKVVKLKY